MKFLFRNALVNHLNKNLRIAPKIYIAFSLVVILLISAGIQEFMSVRFLMKNIREIQSISLLYEPLNNILELSCAEDGAISEFVICNDNEELITQLSVFSENRKKIDHELEILITMLSKDAFFKNNSELISELKSIKSDHNEILPAIKDSLYTLSAERMNFFVPEIKRTNTPDSLIEEVLLVTRSAEQIKTSIHQAKSKLKSYYANVKAKLGHVNSDIDALRTNKVQESEEEETYVMYVILAGLLIGIFVALIIASFVIDRITKPIVAVSRNIEKLAMEQEVEILASNDNDEIGDIITNVNMLSSKMKDIAVFAKDVGNNNFNSDVGLSAEGILGSSLLSMRENLRKAKAENELAAQEDEKRNWATQGMARSAEILRSNNSDLNRLSDEIVLFMVQYLKANQGAIFIADSEDTGEEMSVFMRACYAWDRKKHIDKEIKIGEGLVGQCLIEKETIYITDIPDDYISIRSGLGEAEPKSILLVPLKLNDSIFGVIELASFREFRTHEIEFIEKLSESIASTISSVSINNRTSLLLEESKRQGEQLAQQEEEMRQNMEEMQATQEELHRKEQDLLQKIAENESIRREQEELYKAEREAKEKSTADMAEQMFMLEDAVRKMKKNEKALKAKELEMQEMNQELRAQEEELRQNLEELKTTQEEIQKQTTEKIQIEEEMKQQIMNQMLLAEEKIFELKKAHKKEIKELQSQIDELRKQ